MEFVFCGKWDTRTVLVMHKYYEYFRYFVGICFILHTHWIFSDNPDCRPLEITILKMKL